MALPRALRALPALSVVVLFVNDHALKKWCPGVATGKLSDVAGMIFFPVLLVALVSRVAPLLGTRAHARDARRSDRLLLAACIATALVFTLTKTTLLGNEAYRVGWGALQWPWRALVALVHGHAAPKLARVMLVRDPTDLLAVPFVIVAYLSRATAWDAPRSSSTPSARTLS